MRRLLPKLAIASLLVVSTTRGARADSLAPEGREEAEKKPRVVASDEVVMKDGSRYRGELVEEVVGDHVTIRLVTGEVRTFASVDVASVGPLPLRRQRPPPELAPDEVTREPEESAQSLFVGVGTAVFSAQGALFVEVGYEPWRWLGVEVAAGIGGGLGPSTRETVRYLISPGSSTLRIGPGIGLSQSFLLRDSASPDPAKSYPGAPGVAHFLTPDLALDWSVTRNLRFRSTLGFAFLLNPSGYRAMCTTAGATCLSGESSIGGPDAWAVANKLARDESSISFVSRFELHYAFSL